MPLSGLPRLSSHVLPECVTTSHNKRYRKRTVCLLRPTCTCEENSNITIHRPSIVRSSTCFSPRLHIELRLYRAASAANLSWPHLAPAERLSQHRLAIRNPRRIREPLKEQTHLNQTARNVRISWTAVYTSLPALITPGNGSGYLFRSL